MKLGEQLAALHVGHHDVRDHHVGGAPLKGPQRLASVAADFDFARGVAERLLEQALVNRIVLNDQYSMRHAGIGPLPHRRSNFQTELVLNGQSGNSIRKAAYMRVAVRMTHRRDRFLPPRGQKRDGRAGSAWEPFSTGHPLVILV
jgi:hypothetical protein